MLNFSTLQVKADKRKSVVGIADMARRKNDREKV